MTLAKSMKEIKCTHPVIYTGTRFISKLYILILVIQPVTVISLSSFKKIDFSIVSISNPTYIMSYLQDHLNRLHTKEWKAIQQKYVY